MPDSRKADRGCAKLKDKLVRIIVMITMTALVLTGCGNGGSKASDKGNHTKSRQTTVNDILNEKTSTDNNSSQDNTENSDEKNQNAVSEKESSDDKSQDVKSENSKSDDKSKTKDTEDSKDKDSNKKSGKKKDSSSKKSESKTIDVDLTTLSSTMVYSEVFSMMSVPQEYVGKRIKMKGLFAYYKDTQTNKDYYACIIQDATACCAQGIEFELEGNHKYPRDYPRIDEEFCVQGVFDEYEENGFKFYRLAHAEMVK